MRPPDSRRRHADAAQTLPRRLAGTDRCVTQPRMAKDDHSKVAALEWKALAESLRGGRRGAASESELRNYFGDAEFEELQTLAAHSRLRAAEPKAGNVVVVPGIMGSSLSTVRDGDEDVVWINFLRLVWGRIERLKLAADAATEADPQYTVLPTNVDKRTYARVLLFLQARWNVEAFPFDWRKDIDAAAHALAAFVRDKFAGEPVHIVAHSMGGLVSRNFIRLHRDLWDSICDGSGGRGGRLIMLGTPNYGSFAIPQALTGEEKLVKILAAADLSHNETELLEILDTFVGSYQMLPAPAKLPPAAQSLYRPETWGAFPISRRHLERAFQFHADLQHADTIDSARMVYVAGCGCETLAGVTILGNGEFAYTTTYDGDGRVPHALGLLDGVPTYYIDENHGDLPRNKQVLRAVDDLLEQGTTTALARQPIPSRALRLATARWQRPAQVTRACEQVRTVAARLADKEAQPEEIRAAEEQLRDATLGGITMAAPEKAIAAPHAERKQELPVVQVELLRGDITLAAAPVVVVGHYKGVAPVRAEGAVDAALGYWISQAQTQGMIGADLGEVFFIPAAGTELAAKAVLLAGMGEPGRFSREDLRFLMTNVTFAITSLGADHFASVLVGSGEGSLPRDHALRAMLAGIGDALHRLPAQKRKTAGKRNHRLRLILIENNQEVFDELKRNLRELQESPEATGVTLRIGPTRRLPAVRRRAGGSDRPVGVATNPLAGQRITVERNGGTFRFSALSESAVIPVREVEVRDSMAHAAAERLMTVQSQDEQEKYGQLLADYLLPGDFQSLIEDPPVTLILDSQTAAFPWEMACVRGARGIFAFGPDLRLTRQFRTMLSRVRGIVPMLNRDLKVLVIADPAPEPELQLPGARSEGREVARVFESFKQRLQIDLVTRIGSLECDPLELLAMLLDGNFDVVHFAGHGVFDDQHPAHSGWVFGADCILTPSDIFKARRVPRLVFANACFSAVIKDRPALTAEGMNKSLAGLAEAFFERGVQNYIGAGWPVADDLAVQLASIFYNRCLEGEELPDALAEARRQIQHRGTTWGAYQHYGQVNTQLVTRAD